MKNAKTSSIKLLVFALAMTGNMYAQNTSIQNIEPRVEALLAKMTLEEKIGQLNQMAGDISTGTDVKNDDLLSKARAGRRSSATSRF